MAHRVVAGHSSAGASISTAGAHVAVGPATVASTMEVIRKRIDAMAAHIQTSTANFEHLRARISSGERFDGALREIGTRTEDIYRMITEVRPAADPRAVDELELRFIKLSKHDVPEYRSYVEAAFVYNEIARNCMPALQESLQAFRACTASGEPIEGHKTAIRESLASIRGFLNTVRERLFSRDFPLDEKSAVQLENLRARFADLTRDLVREGAVEERDIPAFPQNLSLLAIYNGIAERISIAAEFHANLAPGVIMELVNKLPPALKGQIIHAVLARISALGAEPVTTTLICSYIKEALWQNISNEHSPFFVSIFRPDLAPDVEIGAEEHPIVHHEQLAGVLAFFEGIPHLTAEAMSEAEYAEAQQTARIFIESLPMDLQNAIHGNIWKLAGRPNEGDFGKTHVVANLLHTEAAVFVLSQTLVKHLDEAGQEELIQRQIQNLRAVRNQTACHLLREDLAKINAILETANAMGALSAEDYYHNKAQLMEQHVALPDPLQQLIRSHYPEEEAGQAQTHFLEGTFLDSLDHYQAALVGAQGKIEADLHALGGADDEGPAPVVIEEEVHAIDPAELPAMEAELAAIIDTVMERDASLAEQAAALRARAALFMDESVGAPAMAQKDLLEGILAQIQVDRSRLSALAEPDLERALNDLVQIALRKGLHPDRMNEVDGRVYAIAHAADPSIGGHNWGFHNRGKNLQRFVDAINAIKVGI